MLAGSGPLNNRANTATLVGIIPTDHRDFARVRRLPLRGRRATRACRGPGVYGSSALGP
jgi:hypothetical protein